MTRIALIGSAAAIALTLAGCDQLREATGMGGEANNGAAANTAATTGGGNVALSAPGGGTGGKPAGGATDNPLLASQMTAAAAQLQSTLPMTVDNVTTLTAVRADGTQFVYEMQISRDLAPGEIENARQLIQAQNQTNLCRDPNTSRLINMGGSMRHIYTDPNGDRFETLVGACAG
jgi:hypothetical protein